MWSSYYKGKKMWYAITFFQNNVKNNNTLFENFISEEVQNTFFVRSSSANVISFYFIQSDKSRLQACFSNKYLLRYCLRKPFKHSKNISMSK